MKQPKHFLDSLRQKSIHGLVILGIIPALFMIRMAGAQPSTSTASAAEKAEAGLEVVLLGTGIPLPNPDRATAATLVIAGDRSFLVDTGRGSAVRLNQAGYTDVSAVLYTHYHSDHIADLGEILVGRGIAGATQPLRIFGPPGAEEVASGFQAAYALDTNYRVTHHGEHFAAQAVTCDVRECAPGVIYDEAGLKITMFEVNHEPVVPAVGYRFDFNGTSVVISGDTKRSENLIRMAQGCDILVHESMNEVPLRAIGRGLQRNDPRRAQMLRDAMSHHTSTLEVARIANETGAKKVVLTHLLPSIAPNESNEAAYVRGMSEIYSGPIIVGRDLMRIKP